MGPITRREQMLRFNKQGHLAELEAALAKLRLDDRRRPDLVRRIRQMQDELDAGGE